MKKTKIVFFTTAPLVFLFLLFVIFTEMAGISWSNTVVMETCQGDYVKYSPGITYCLRIVKQQHTLSYRYYILISRKEINDYGQVLNYPITDLVDEKDFKKIRVIWATDGIEITFKTGHKLFIPKETLDVGR